MRWTVAPAAQPRAKTSAATIKRLRLLKTHREVCRRAVPRIKLCLKLTACHCHGGSLLGCNQRHNPRSKNVMGSLRLSRSDAEIRHGSFSHRLVVGSPKSREAGRNVEVMCSPAAAGKRSDIVFRDFIWSAPKPRTPPENARILIPGISEAWECASTSSDFFFGIRFVSEMSAPVLIICLQAALSCAS